MLRGQSLVLFCKMAFSLFGRHGWFRGRALDCWRPASINYAPRSTLADRGPRFESRQRHTFSSSSLAVVKPEDSWRVPGSTLFTRLFSVFNNVWVIVRPQMNFLAFPCPYFPLGHRAQDSY